MRNLLRELDGALAERDAQDSNSYEGLSDDWLSSALSPPAFAAFSLLPEGRPQTALL